MSKLIAMIKNENMKIYRRPRTWIMLGLLVLITGFFNFVMSTFGGETGMENGSAIDSLMISANFVMFVAIFSVIIAGDIVSSEFGWGTVKLLLIRPISRSKVLLAKYIAVIIFTLFFLLCLFVFSYLFGLIFFGTGEGYFTLQDVLVEYAYGLPPLIIGFTIAFMISAAFRSSALAIGLSIFLMTVGGDIVIGLLSDYEWAKYILYANTDLTQYREGMRPMIEGMTMGFSLTMLAIYYIAFIAITWWVFNKRDVAN